MYGAEKGMHPYRVLNYLALHQNNRPNFNRAVVFFFSKYGDGQDLMTLVLVAKYKHKFI